MSQMPACSVAIMFLQEQFGIPILDIPDLAAPSGCLVAGTLAAMYEAVDVNGRKGANITSRIIITGRIAASRAHFIQSSYGGTALDRLTRAFLRALNMPASEAADVCRFASSVVNALSAPYVGVALDLDGVSFVLYKVKGSRGSYAAALPREMKASFKSLMVYQG